MSNGKSRKATPSVDDQRISRVLVNDEKALA